MYAASDIETTSPQAVPPIYQFAAYSMDTLWSVPGTTPGADANDNLLMALTSNYTSAWSTASANFGVMKMYDENYLCATSDCTSGLMVDKVGDVATNYDVALSSINATMPTPGNGTNVPGDSPQEVLFFVTDGMEDELISGVRVYEQINGPSWSTPDYCTTIKNRGIKIAVLYTTYLPTLSSAWYNEYIASFMPDIAPALQACASPGLFIQAAIGDDLGADLINLFEIATQPPHLTN